ncbi:hypothetical protein HRbin39_00539 [bacterium HR39]|nr:hypothetical protein HRbin39_00539 [bacterium HR39]
MIRTVPAGGGARAVLRRLCVLWAVAGGSVLLALVLVNVASVVGTAFLGMPVPGDIELTEMGVAVAAFAFLPYCQLAGAHVIADIFTARLDGRTRARFEVLGDLVALVFALVLLWRMSLGMLDQRAYGYTTAILQIPVWWAFVPILVSLVLLALAAGERLADHLRGEGAR